jgi:hypothetical protein
MENEKMKTYDVTIKAEIYKTITVTAEDENSAYVEAHEVFSVASDDWPEKYNEETISVVEVLPC